MKLLTWKVLDSVRSYSDDKPSTVAEWMVIRSLVGMLLPTRPLAMMTTEGMPLIL
jgi:hypothetical protein